MVWPLLDTATRRWQQLPDPPAAGIAAKAIDMAWTRDGRLVSRARPIHVPADRRDETPGSTPARALPSPAKQTFA